MYHVSSTRRMNKSEIVGKYIRSTSPNEADRIVGEFTAILRDPSLVEKIYNHIEEHYSHEDREHRRLLFIGCTYQAFQPLSYLPRIKGDSDTAQAAGKLPVGVRDEMKRCLGLANAESVNGYKYQTEPWLKPESNGVIRQFKVDVMKVVDQFRCYSNDKNVLQFKMELQ